jgi:hypothetical protein
MRISPPNSIDVVHDKNTSELKIKVHWWHSKVEREYDPALLSLVLPICCGGAVMSGELRVKHRLHRIDKAPALLPPPVCCKCRTCILPFDAKCPAFYCESCNEGKCLTCYFKAAPTLFVIPSGYSWTDCLRIMIAKTGKLYLIFLYEM